MLKCCTRCLLDKPTEEFFRQASCRDGLNPRCKACVKVNVAEKYREHGRRDVATWRARNPKEHRAHRLVRAAIKSGELTPLDCQICDSDKIIDAHHRDYDQPLVVVWLCRRCHRRMHNLFPELEGANRSPDPTKFIAEAA